MTQNDAKPFRVGLVPVMIELYDRLLPDLRADLMATSRELAQGCTGNGLEVITSDLATGEDDILSSWVWLEGQGVDLLVVAHVAYCPSGQIFRALRGYKGPLLLWPVQSVSELSPSRFDQASLIRNHGVHGTQDLASMLVRQRRPFGTLHGFWKDPECARSLTVWAQASRAIRAMQEARPIQIAGQFQDMLDLQFDDAPFLERMGGGCCRLTAQRVIAAARSVSQQEACSLLSQYREEFEWEDGIQEEIIFKAARHELALRQILAESGSKALGINFLGLCNDPEVADGLHVAASRLMAEGVGYGGEGDWITAVLVRGLLASKVQSSFSEMFFVGYDDGRVLLRHWGEGNVAMARRKPRLRKSAFKDAHEAEFAVVDFEFAEGPATLVNLCCDEDGKGRLIAVRGAIDPDSFPSVEGPRGAFKPDGDVVALLDSFAQAGGTHHLALTVGDAAELVGRMARLTGWTPVLL